MNNSTEIRSDLNIVQQGRTILWSRAFLFLCVKLSKPGAADSAPAVVGNLADGTNDLTEVLGVQLYEPVINIIVHSTSVAFRNFHHSWVSVLMDHPDLHLSPVIISRQCGILKIKAGCTSFSRSQNLYYWRNEALIIWDDRLKA